MEFVLPNLFNTTTQATVDSNTTVVSNLINRDITRQYVSDGFNDDLTTTTITVAFDATTNVSRIGLFNNNFKDFTAYYNGATASTFTISGATTVSDFSSNSATSLYMTAAQVAATSVSIDITATMVADNEKALGLLFVSDSLLSFERIPSAKNYRPALNPKQATQKLSDGGIKINTVSQKWSTKVKFKHITSTFRDNLKTVYDRKSEFVFVPFPTTTSWDEIFYEAIWRGPFSFFRYSDDAVSAGFTGDINLLETPW